MSLTSLHASDMSKAPSSTYLTSNKGQADPACSLTTNLSYLTIDNSIANRGTEGCIVDDSAYPIVRIRIRNNHDFWKEITIPYNLNDDTVIKENIWAQFGFIPPNSRAEYTIYVDPTDNSSIQFFVNAARSEDGVPRAGLLNVSSEILNALNIPLGEITDPGLLVKILQTLESSPDLIPVAEALADRDMIGFVDAFANALSEDAVFEIIASIVEISGGRITKAEFLDVFTIVQIAQSAWRLVGVIGSIIIGSYAGTVIFEHNGYTSPAPTANPIVTSQVVTPTYTPTTRPTATPRPSTATPIPTNTPIPPTATPIPQSCTNPPPDRNVAYLFANTNCVNPWNWSSGHPSDSAGHAAKSAWMPSGKVLVLSEHNNGGDPTVCLRNPVQNLADIGWDNRVEWASLQSSCPVTQPTSTPTGPKHEAKFYEEPNYANHTFTLQNPGTYDHSDLGHADQFHKFYSVDLCSGCSIELTNARGDSICWGWDENNIGSHGDWPLVTTRIKFSHENDCSPRQPKFSSPEEGAQFWAGDDLDIVWYDNDDPTSMFFTVQIRRDGALIAQTNRTTTRSLTLSNMAAANYTIQAQSCSNIKCSDWKTRSFMVRAQPTATPTATFTPLPTATFTPTATPTQCPPPPPPPSYLVGDVDGDGDVDNDDFEFVEAIYEETAFDPPRCPGWSVADINLDGRVDISDISIVIANMGQALPTPTITPTATPTVVIDFPSRPDIPTVNFPQPMQALQPGTLIFNWQSLSYPASYLIYIERDGSRVADSGNISGTSWGYTFREVGVYQWTISALCAGCDEYFSGYSQSFDIFVGVEPHTPIPTSSPTPVADDLPDMPTNVQLLMTDEDYVEIFWEAARNAQYYTIHRSNLSGQSNGWELIGTTEEVSFTDDTVFCGDKFAYGIIAINSSGQTPSENLYEITVKCIPDSTPTNTPSPVPTATSTVLYPPKPQIPVVIAPHDDVVVEPGRAIIFEWDPLLYPAEYLIYIDHDGQRVADSGALLSTSWAFMPTQLGPHVWTISSLCSECADNFSGFSLSYVFHVGDPPTATPTHTPIPAHTIVSTNTPVPTHTSIPTPTYTPTFTPTPIPIPTTADTVVYPTKPDIPQVLAPNDGIGIDIGESVTFSWQALSYPAEYLIYIDRDNERITDSGAIADSSWAFTFNEPGTYTWIISALCSGCQDNFSGFSSTYTIYAGGLPPDAPKNIRLILTENNKVNISWAPAANAKTYGIYRSSSSLDENDGELIGTTEGFTHADEAVECGDYFVYKIVAINQQGRTSSSDTPGISISCNETTTPVAPLEPPISATATPKPLVPIPTLIPPTPIPPTPIPPTPVPPTPIPPTPEPVCSVSIGNGQLYTNRRDVEIQTSVTDAAKIQLSNDGGFGGAVWQPYSSVISWKLSDPPQDVATLLVYARFRNRQGDLLCSSATAIDDIIYDVQVPTVRIVSFEPTVKAATREQPLTTSGQLSLEATDQENGSGIPKMRIGTTADLSNVNWQPFVSPAPITVQDAQMLYAQVRDGAGNESDVVSWALTNDTQLYLPLIR